MCRCTPAATLLLPATNLSTAAARAGARRSGCTEHAVALLDDKLLLINELVTNTVLHGGPPIVLSVHYDGGDLMSACGRLTHTARTEPSTP